MSSKEKNNEPKSSGKSSREHLLGTALRLFAEHGIEGIGLREIVQEAGHKNVGSLRYHFGSKEGLIRAILEEVARSDAEAWDRRLDHLERSGRVITLRDIIWVHVAPTIEMELNVDNLRFIAQARITHLTLAREVHKHADRALSRFENLLRKLLRGIPAKILDHRLDLLETYTTSVLIAYDPRTHGASPHGAWSSQRFVENFLDTAEGLLTAPVSPATRRAYRKPAGRQ